MTTAERTVPFLDLGAIHNDLRAEFSLVWDDVVATGGFIGGDHVARFERSWADYCGVAHAVGVANGTDSIELVLRALGIGVDDEVIVPANTFIATAEAVVACGAAPVFVDVDPDTLLVTAENIEPGITSATAAVIPVHLYGQPCQMDAINDLATRHQLAVVEDAAQAHGARWRDRRAGSMGSAASFSFYPGKNLGAFGDGGAVVTDDAELAARVRSLANHGRADGEHVVHSLMGRNSRLDALHAGILLAKLPHLDRWNDARRERYGRYAQRLGEIGVPHVAEHVDASSVWHLNVVQVDERDRVAEAMRSRGVDVRIHYPEPCHHHPGLTAEQPGLPVVEAAAARILSLPMSPTMSDDDVDYVCGQLEASIIELGVAS